MKGLSLCKRAKYRTCGKFCEHKCACKKMEHFKSIPTLCSCVKNSFISTFSNLVPNGLSEIHYNYEYTSLVSRMQVCTYEKLISEEGDVLVISSDCQSNCKRGKLV